MKYIHEFRQAPGISHLIDEISMQSRDRTMTFMEVCGTHTMAIARFGIRDLLPDNIVLISGPGCPVCVTPNADLDRIIAMAAVPGVCVATFGDMVRVPGSRSSLERERAKGADVHVVASTLEALDLAVKNPDKRVVFVGVGFETTAPTVAVSLEESRKHGIDNYFVFSAHKRVIPAMESLIKGDVRIDGFLCPGHVSAVIGSEPYESLVRPGRTGCVVAGFEPADILLGILRLVGQVREGKPRVENAYARVVLPGGNPEAMDHLSEVFETCDSEWRGLGSIPESGYRIREAYSSWDARVRIPVVVGPPEEHESCLCGDVLQGKVQPSECALFGERCVPDDPVGPCMVSTEGTCAAHYRYRK